MTRVRGAWALSASAATNAGTEAAGALRSGIGRPLPNQIADRTGARSATTATTTATGWPRLKLDPAMRSRKSCVPTAAAAMRHRPSSRVAGPGHGRTSSDDPGGTTSTIAWSRPIASASATEGEEGQDHRPPVTTQQREQPGEDDADRHPQGRHSRSARMQQQDVPRRERRVGEALGDDARLEQQSRGIGDELPRPRQQQDERSDQRQQQPGDNGGPVHAATNLEHDRGADAGDQQHDPYRRRNCQHDRDKDRRARGPPERAARRRDAHQRTDRERQHDRRHRGADPARRNGSGHGGQQRVGGAGPGANNPVRHQSTQCDVGGPAGERDPEQQQNRDGRRGLAEEDERDSRDDDRGTAAPAWSSPGRRRATPGGTSPRGRLRRAAMGAGHRLGARRRRATGRGCRRSRRWPMPQSAGRLPEAGFVASDPASRRR